MGTPSTTMNGLLVSLLLKVPIPRMVIVGCAPNFPLLLITVKPGTTPCNAFEISEYGRDSRVLLTSTVDTAPVKFAFFCVPYPTTTTSSSSFSLDFSTTFITGRTGSSSVFIPMYEKTNAEAFAGTFKVKTPLTSVAIPTLVPFAKTEAPITGSPFSFFTLPDTRVCAKLVPIPMRNKNNNNLNLFFMELS